MTWIDAHHHIWRLERGDYTWLTPDLKPLYQDYDLADYHRALQDAQLSGSLLIQAAPSVAETEYLLREAEQDRTVLGVVGWVDLASLNAPEEIERLAKSGRLCGVRPMLQDLPESDWILGEQLQPALEACQTQQLAFDALVRSEQIPFIITLADRHPELTIVLNHAGKPEIASDNLRDWKRAIADLAKRSNVVCKFSGFPTQAPRSWGASDFQDVFHTILDAFGADRLLWGSDWPFMIQAGPVNDWIIASRALTAALSNSERDQIFAGTANRVYRLAALVQDRKK